MGLADDFRRVLTAGLASVGLVVMLAAAPAKAQTDDILTLDLAYDGKLYIKVLDIRFREQITPTRHSAEARLASSGILSAFRKIELRSTTAGPMVRGEPQPGQFMHVNLDGKKNRRVDVAWTGAKVTAHAAPTYSNWGEPPATESEKLAAADPLTQLARLMLASTQDGPCQGTTRFFNGKELYDLGFSNPQKVAVSKADAQLGLVNGLRCNAVYKEVAGFKKKTGKDANNGINRPITLDFAQVGEDGPWVITRMRAHTPLGAAVIDLARLKASGGLVGRTQLANRAGP